MKPSKKHIRHAKGGDALAAAADPGRTFNVSADDCPRQGAGSGCKACYSVPEVRGTVNP